MHINKKMLFAALLASQVWFLGVFAMSLPAPRDSNSDNASRSPECECSKCENPVSFSAERRKAMEKAFQASQEAAEAMKQEEVVKIILQENKNLNEDGFWPSYMTENYNRMPKSRWAQIKAYLASWIG